MEFKGTITFSGDEAPMALLMLSVMGAFAEFERTLLKERQKEGIELAKRRGVYRGCKQILSLEQVTELKTRVRQGERKSDLARFLNIGRETLYQY